MVYETKKYVIIKCHICGKPNLVESAHDTTKCKFCGSAIKTTVNRVLFGSNNKEVARTMLKTIKAQEMSTEEPCFKRFKLEKKRND